MVTEDEHRPETYSRRGALLGLVAYIVLILIILSVLV